MNQINHHHQLFLLPLLSHFFMIWKILKMILLHLDFQLSFLLLYYLQHFHCCFPHHFQYFLLLLYLRFSYLLLLFQYFLLLNLRFSYLLFLFQYFLLLHLNYQCFLLLFHSQSFFLQLKAFLLLYQHSLLHYFILFLLIFY